MADLIRGVHILPLEVPITGAVEIVGAAASDYSDVGRLRKFSVIPDGINAELCEAFDGRIEVLIRAAEPRQLSRDAIHRKRSRRRQLPADRNITGAIGL